MTFNFKGKQINLSNHAHMEDYPLLSHTQVKRALKKEHKAYMVYVTEVEKEQHPSLSPQQHSFLDAYHDCFADD